MGDLPKKEAMLGYCKKQKNPQNPDNKQIKNNQNQNQAENQNQQNFEEKFFILIYLLPYGNEGQQNVCISMRAQMPGVPGLAQA